VTYVASFVLGKLLRLGQRCRELDLPMAFGGAPPKVLRQIESVGVAAAFGHFTSVEEPVAAVRGTQARPRCVSQRAER